MQDNFSIDDENPMISREYGINTETYMNAFGVFQKKYVYPRNYVMTALFLAVAVYYLYLMLCDMENMSYMLFIAISLMMIFSMWFTVYNQKIKLRNAVGNNADDKYKLEVFNEGITVELFQNDIQQSNSSDVENSKESDFQHSNTEIVENGVVSTVDEDFFAAPPQSQNEKTRIKFAPNIVVIDKKEFFIVYIKKSVFYIIPKNAFSEEEILIMQQHFENRLEKNYMKK